MTIADDTTTTPISGGNPSNANGTQSSQQSQTTEFDLGIESENTDPIVQGEQAISGEVSPVAESQTSDDFMLEFGESSAIPSEQTQDVLNILPSTSESTPSQESPSESPAPSEDLISFDISPAPEAIGQNEQEERSLLSSSLPTLEDSSQDQESSTIATAFDEIKVDLPENTLPERTETENSDFQSPSEITLDIPSLEGSDTLPADTPNEELSLDLSEASPLEESPSLSLEEPKSEAQEESFSLLESSPESQLDSLPLQEETPSQEGSSSTPSEFSLDLSDNTSSEEVLAEPSFLSSEEITSGEDPNTFLTSGENPLVDLPASEESPLLDDQRDSPLSGSSDLSTPTLEDSPSPISAEESTASNTDLGLDFGTTLSESPSEETGDTLLTSEEPKTSLESSDTLSDPNTFLFSPATEETTATSSESYVPTEEAFQETMGQLQQAKSEGANFIKSDDLPSSESSNADPIFGTSDATFFAPPVEESSLSSSREGNQTSIEGASLGESSEEEKKVLSLDQMVAKFDGNPIPEDEPAQPNPADMDPFAAMKKALEDQEKADLISKGISVDEGTPLIVQAAAKKEEEVPQQELVDQTLSTDAPSIQGVEYSDGSDIKVKAQNVIDLDNLVLDGGNSGTGAGPAAAGGDGVKNLEAGALSGLGKTPTQAKTQFNATAFLSSLMKNKATSYVIMGVIVVMGAIVVVSMFPGLFSGNKNNDNNTLAFNPDTQINDNSDYTDTTSDSPDPVVNDITGGNTDFSDIDSSLGNVDVPVNQWGEQTDDGTPFQPDTTDIADGHGSPEVEELDANQMYQLFSEYQEDGKMYKDTGNLNNDAYLVKYGGYIQEKSAHYLKLLENGETLDMNTFSKVQATFDMYLVRLQEQLDEGKWGLDLPQEDIPSDAATGSDTSDSLFDDLSGDNLPGENDVFSDDENIINTIEY